MKGKIVVAGSVAYDRINNLSAAFEEKILPDKIHKLNVAFGVRSVKEDFGGTGGNIAYNLSLLGFKPILLGCVGYDFQKYEEWLNKSNVDISKLGRFFDCVTAVANINTDRNNNQITFFFHGSRDVQYCDILRDVKNVELMIISPDYYPRMMRYVELCQELGVSYIFDPGQAVGSMNRDDLKKAISGSRMLICNEYEYFVIMREIGGNLKSLLSMTDIFVCTKGSHGSEIATKDRVFILPCAKVDKVLDPTGAGDAYRAGFIKGLIEGWDLSRTGRFAGVASAYAVEQYGTQNHHFSMKEIKERYKNSY
ncbi:hypothetical protein A2331_03235 [Candidatus Falkowbacteria bacterium RIFOXYB2_FULL_34_18]|uniref:Carbohydrate kinase PfkB domain-containing protein n=1 Tax=Candidatus Falkowbacteria bacterium RIFOXYD2_FULL_34_120 TaxID=1798007 RepID=A0A1F5TMK6_9BACT|nr:MAG: hypothetical protein A2500_02530 [Candidatus Falkowbacteria bacterium RIFOXYC12_FULL_34_55]OGF28590.1 MAG: hypothetical protein A2331_03235 [Candidatus Falkowbacteria bacterium RIFOXYB2_FULL_34_18]OGF38031.1 MAG: hypothetical protein A2466_06950 [Candidatus Falkowbacteria bacterium RIFOXYC2_FULL_34_220]OGF38280.1 MAG: hypothetical protein A2515_04985 [Candidatus Falkowbacteria bacterium RIFOXYD12_FULL_34_57]OGF40192.1 MAG: hypothetical protein A2531_01180 [Candidatus Falkowbacteria bact